MATVVLLLLVVGAFLALGTARAPMWAWAVAVGLLTLLGQSGALDGAEAAGHGILSWIAWLPFVALSLLSIPSLRRSLIVAPVFDKVRTILPKVSDTEAQALEAGTVGFDAEIFSGTPDWDKLRSIPPIQLTTEEQAFLDGPTHQLCAMINDWQVRHQPARDPRGYLGFRQEARLPRHADFEGARRPRLLAAGAVADPRQDRLALARRRDHRHGAELARPGRADREVRHRRSRSIITCRASPRARKCPAFR